MFVDVCRCVSVTDFASLYLLHWLPGRGGLDVARAGPYGESKRGDSRELGTAIDTAALPSQVPVDPTHHQPEREQRWAPPPAPHAPVQPHGDRGGTEHVCVGWPQLGSFDGHVALGFTLS